MFEKMNW